jgi:hypothetical protein
MSDWVKYIVYTCATAFVAARAIPVLFGKQKANQTTQNESSKSGFIIKYEVKDAGFGKGKGVFACENIRKGQKVWGLVDGNHTLLDEEGLNNRLKGLSLEEKKHVLNHIYGRDDEIMIELNDNSQYWNHSSKPNVVSGDKLTPPIDDMTSCFAGRDISAGEELVDDYGLYGLPSWYLRLCAEYGVESSKDVATKYA